MTHFDYLLNAFEHASQADNPAKEGYAEKRRALLAYVRELESYKQDAERYRFLKSLRGLEILMDRTAWTRPDGYTYRGSIVLRGNSTQFGPGPSVDAVIDAARKGEGE